MLLDALLRLADMGLECPTAVAAAAVAAAASCKCRRRLALEDLLLCAWRESGGEILLPSEFRHVQVWTFDFDMNCYIVKKLHIIDNIMYVK